MQRAKFNKKAFVIAALVILLCLTALSGATYALFTSATEDGKIGINTTSGKLKVDIIDASEDNPQSLVGDVLDFITTQSQTEILFEPGATFYTEGFRVKNNGNIPLNFILYISEDEAISPDFFTAFDVWLTNDPTSRTGMVKLQEFDGRLEVNQSSDVYYLVFHMKEEIGNDFQGQEFTGVGITVCAVQGNVDIGDVDIK
jgi:hypothetical protein